MRPLLGSTGIFLAVLICVQCWWSTGVEAKNRNRVQKWQQRNWKSRFGSGPRNDWKFDWPPAASGKAPRRKNVYASVRFGGSGSSIRNELGVPNGYSNYHYRFDDQLGPVSQAGVGARRDHRVGKKKNSVVTLNENGIENYRMKRFASMEAYDDDDELVRFSNDLRRDSPFVFGSDKLSIDDDQEHQRLSNDLADLDFVRDDENIDFVPIQPGPNQRYITVEENDPFPHALPPPPKKNATRKVQYTLIIHHGHSERVSSQENSAVVSRYDGVTLPLLLLMSLCRLLVAHVLPHFRDW